MDSKDPLTKELTKWVKKEIDQLSNSAVRLALLAIINQNQSTGIYGYAIGENLYLITKGELGGTNATFYAILRRLEQDQLVVSELKPSPTGPARKYYRLTTKGERAYQALFENWRYYYDILKNLIERS